MDLEQLKYPIGTFTVPTTITPDLLAAWVADIAAFPEKLKDEVSQLNEQQLNYTYRPAGWSIRQVIHHCADSHMNSLIRFKLTLTEEVPMIKPYKEDQWAELSDAQMPVGPSLQLLDALHSRWVNLLNTLTEQELARCYYHPEQQKEIDLRTTIGLYAWHGNHHLAHVKQAKRQHALT